MDNIVDVQYLRGSILSRVHVRKEYQGFRQYKAAEQDMRWLHQMLPNHGPEA